MNSIHEKLRKMKSKINFVKTGYFGSSKFTVPDAYMQNAASNLGTSL